MDFEDWLRIGYRNGWCGPPVCSTHDGTPTAYAEDEEFDDGGDPCIHIIRLYESDEQRTAVEEAHPPSQWRASNRDLTRSDAEGSRPDAE